MTEETTNTVIDLGISINAERDNTSPRAKKSRTFRLKGSKRSGFKYFFSDLARAVSQLGKDKLTTDTLSSTTYKLHRFTRPETMSAEHNALLDKLEATLERVARTGKSVTQKASKRASADRLGVMHKIKSLVMFFVPTKESQKAEIQAKLKAALYERSKTTAGEPFIHSTTYTQNADRAAKPAKITLYERIRRAIRAMRDFADRTDTRYKRTKANLVYRKNTLISNYRATKNRLMPAKLKAYVADDKNKKKDRVAITHFLFSSLAIATMAAKRTVNVFRVVRAKWQQIRQTRAAKTKETKALPSFLAKMTKTQAVAWSLMGVMALSPFFAKQSVNNDGDVTAKGNDKAAASVAKAKGSAAPDVVKVKDVYGNMVDKRFAFTADDEKRLDASLAALEASVAAKTAKPTGIATTGKSAAITPEKYNPLLHIPAQAMQESPKTTIEADKRKVVKIYANQQKKEGSESIKLTPPTNYKPVREPLHIAKTKGKVLVSPQQTAKEPLVKETKAVATKIEAQQSKKLYKRAPLPQAYSGLLSQTQYNKLSRNTQRQLKSVSESVGHVGYTPISETQARRTVKAFAAAAKELSRNFKDPDGNRGALELYKKLFVVARDGDIYSTKQVFEASTRTAHMLLKGVPGVEQDLNRAGLYVLTGDPDSQMHKNDMAELAQKYPERFAEAKKTVALFNDVGAFNPLDPKKLAQGIIANRTAKL